MAETDDSGVVGIRQAANDLSARAHAALGFEEVVVIRCFRKDLRE